MALKNRSTEQIPVVNQYPLIGKPFLSVLVNCFGKYFLAVSDKKILAPHQLKQLVGLAYKELG